MLAMLAAVALSIASELGVSDRPLLMAVVTGASLAFMSPVAHQANAMVMGPGDYRYRDFLRVGTPLTVGLFGFAVLAIPWIWPMSPIAG
jgi:di/tricarboxylate transporter